MPGRNLGVLIETLSDPEVGQRGAGTTSDDHAATESLVSPWTRRSNSLWAYRLGKLGKAKGWALGKAMTAWEQGG